MYATCIFCNHPLGGNDVVEAFPVGRRLAFDAAKGRLWVVCQRCERWNLAPFEERWEALETCEQQFRDARKRVASDNIGLARLDEGLELVRIGEPMRPEFAAWRYGDQFGRRRRRAIITGTAIAAAGGAIVVGGVATGLLTGGGYWVYQMVNGLYRAYRNRRVMARVPLPDGQRVTVRGKHLPYVRLSPDTDHTDGIRLFLPSDERGRSGTTLSGDEALHAATLLMPRINSRGANRRVVQQAVRRIEDHADPYQFLRSVGPSGTHRLRSRRAEARAAGVLKLPLDTRLAIEMAVNEQNERLALEGHLALLELAWKEAEEIAAIADSLALPWGVEAQYEELRRKAGR